MQCFLVNFHFKRKVGVVVEAEDESVIDKFLEKYPSFNPLESDGLDIETDETSYNEEDEHGDYEIVPEKNIIANFVITRDLKLIEVDS